MAAILIGGLTATVTALPAPSEPIFLNVNNTTMNIANDSIIELTQDNTMPILNVNSTPLNIVNEKLVVLQDARQLAGGVLEQWE